MLSNNEKYLVKWSMQRIDFYDTKRIAPLLHHAKLQTNPKVCVIPTQLYSKIQHFSLKQDFHHSNITLSITTDCDMSDDSLSEILDTEHQTRLSICVSEIEQPSFILVDQFTKWADNVAPNHYCLFLMSIVDILFFQFFYKMQNSFGISYLAF